MTTLADLQKRNLTTMVSSDAPATNVDAPAIMPEATSDNVNNTTILQSDKPTDRQTNRPTNNKTIKPRNKQADKLPIKQPDLPLVSPPDEGRGRVDGRTMRVRQDTADLTIVTSLRLAKSTVEALDDFCWQYRKRKQDVVQAALDMYFAVQGEE